ncbi:CDPK-related kinase 3-like [Curcuma longa]|uniref:CDPK-related kinase 3-like n=1 Tax=Curcuma longa TaxID=136217 RepID=UPI003D9F77B6
MGQCHGTCISVKDDYGRHRSRRKKTIPDNADASGAPPPHAGEGSASPFPVRKSSTWPSPYPPGDVSSLPDGGVSPTPARSTSKRFFGRPFPPPSPAKHIKAALAKRQGAAKKKDAVGTGGGAVDPEQLLDKTFGYGKNFGSTYHLGEEVGRGHFGNTCLATAKKGEMKGQTVAVKIIPKAKMTTPISIEDVGREVKILKALSGHKNLVKFYEACEDALNVYIIMEVCEGGELLARILSRGMYAEEDAKAIVVQMLDVVAFSHLQGVVHRDLKPENFLFATKDESSPLKLIDFGLSDFIRADERLNDTVGSSYYVAPEVLHRSYSTEADMWSIGVITYILLCGRRPFWARTESGIFRSVLRADPNFDDAPWPDVSAEAKDFVKRLLNKDYRKRMTAVQALTHPWLRNEQRQIPLDMLVYRLIKLYLRTSPLKRAALTALSKAITEDQLFYLQLQFQLLQPNKDGLISLDNFQMALSQNATEAMKLSRIPEIMDSLHALSQNGMDFDEFCAAAISPYQLEALEQWEQISNTAFQLFEQVGNRVVSVEELAQELNLTHIAHSFLQDWIRPEDGKFSFYGYTKYLHGVTVR